MLSTCEEKGAEKMVSLLFSSDTLSGHWLSSQVSQFSVWAFGKHPKVLWFYPVEMMNVQRLIHSLSFVSWMSQEGGPKRPLLGMRLDSVARELTQAVGPLKVKPAEADLQPILSPVVPNPDQLHRLG